MHSTILAQIEMKRFMIKYKRQILSHIIFLRYKSLVLLLRDGAVDALCYAGFIILSFYFWHRTRKDHLTNQLSHGIFYDAHLALLT